MFVVDGAHESGSRRQDIVNKDENRLLWCELDSFSGMISLIAPLPGQMGLPDDIDELPDGQIL